MTPADRKTARAARAVLLAAGKATSDATPNATGSAAIAPTGLTTTTTTTTTTVAGTEDPPAVHFWRPPASPEPVATEPQAQPGPDEQPMEVQNESDSDSDSPSVAIGHDTDEDGISDAETMGFNADDEASASADDRLNRFFTGKGKNPKGSKRQRFN